MGEYDFDCPYGGLGNWQEHDSVCLVCNFDTECLHESEMRELIKTRDFEREQVNRQTNYRNRSWYRPRTIQPARVSSPTRKERRQRPMPIEGEVPASRLAKNMLAAAVSGAGSEFGDYFERELKRRRDTGGLALLMLFAGCRAAGEECGNFFEEFDFEPTLPPHLDDT